ncbi:MAG: DNA cytosine methyltransferase [Brasilonema angustatum HA4187-MV1]|nr:DNA cytosine methyltransferase [Brasilonema angustatum HA4187-MV1]
MEGMEGQRRLKQFDLCSGIGAGYCFAGAALGLQLVGVAEIDDYCCGILAKRYPGVENFGDIAKLESLPEADIISCSTPCPPFSIRGMRLGADDERDCFPFVVKIVERVRPKYCVIENVPGLLNCPLRPGAKELYINRLAEIFDTLGYRLEGALVSGGSVGSRFVRQRLLLVAVANSIQFSEIPSPWIEQIRAALETNRTLGAGTSNKPSILRGIARNSNRLDRPNQLSYSLGLPKGDRIIRRRREALGNTFDPRLAAIGLHRVLYLESISR